MSEQQEEKEELPDVLSEIEQHGDQHLAQVEGLQAVQHGGMGEVELLVTDEVVGLIQVERWGSSVFF